MQRIRIFSCLVVAVFLVTIAFSQAMYRWTFSSGGRVQSTEDEFTGMTAGQAAQAHVTTMASDSATYGYWHKSWEPEICVSVTPDFWQPDGGDTLDVNSTISMEAGEVIGISNCGNCAIDLGLLFSRSEPYGIESGYYSALNKAVIRAQFRSDEVTPVSYDYERDYVKDVITWATPLFFGPAGENLSTTSTQNLWLQLVTPTRTMSESGSFIRNFQLVLELRAKFTMP